jgi:uncharacterized coiled-coil protein SlyX
MSDKYSEASLIKDLNQRIAEQDAEIKQLRATISEYKVEKACAGIDADWLAEKFEAVGE